MSLAVSLPATLGVVSCDSAIYDYEGDCSVSYRVGFRYTKNQLGADAFGPQVTKVSLYLFDEDGNLAFSKTESRVAGVDNDFYMEVEVTPGKYDMLAWCEGKSMTDDAISYIVTTAASSMSDLSASLPLDGESPRLYSAKDIRGLFHGLELGVEFPDSTGTIDVGPVNLTKDTNHISLQLVNLDGSAIDPEEISVELEARNGILDCLNRPAGEAFVYKPWSVRGFSADNDSRQTPGAASANGLQFELSTGRVMADMEQILTVRAAGGKTILSIPLVEYLLLVRGKYEESKSDQDYLDCHDDFSMVFFIRDGYSWMNSSVIINGWRVVPPQSGIL